jgi:hypothetical protein
MNTASESEPVGDLVTASPEAEVSRHYRQSEGQ